MPSHGAGSAYGPFAHDYDARWRRRQQAQQFEAQQSDASAKMVEQLRREVQSLKERQSETDRAHREAVSAARKQGHAEARDGMSRLSEQLAATQTHNADLKKQLATERLALHTAQAESDRLAAAVKGLAARLQQGSHPIPKNAGSKEAPPWRSVSGEAEMRMLLASALQRTVEAALAPLHGALDFDC